MTDDRKRQSLTADRLREVLDRLNDVLSEAERLRDEITKKLAAQHQEQQQFLAPGGKKRRVRP
jgi:hypothetical protein